MEGIRVAAVQASPVFLDRTATTDKAVDLIAKAGAQGASLVVFPEAFIPTYPLWTWYIKPSEFELVERLYANYLDQSLVVPGPETERLGKAAKAAAIHVAIGVSERNVEASGTSLFNSILFFGPDGSMLGKRRKLVATGPERLVWAQGDGSTVGVVETSIAKLAGLICWENYMPLARFAMYSGGAEIVIAPTWDQSGVWQATMRHIAKEGRCYVVGCSNITRSTDVPASFGLGAHLPEGEWINRGGSLIVDPEGTVIAGPLFEEEGTLVADLDPALLKGVRWNLDVAGHYARPDVFTFGVDRSVRTP